MSKLSFSRHWRTIASVACGLGLAAGLSVYKASADEWNRQTVLNVSQTIQIKDTVLEPGKYVLKAMDSPSNRHIVQIFNANENHIYATVLTIPAERLQATGDTKLVFWETPAGTARALRLWYYPGRLTGDEFSYPKHPFQLAQASQPVASVAPPPPEPQAPPSTVAEAPAPQPAQEPVQLAQNAPPPPPRTAQTVETPAPPASVETVRTLPKTASPYPLYGLSGAISLALFGMLRLTQKSAAQES